MTLRELLEEQKGAIYSKDLVEEFVSYYSYNDNGYINDYFYEFANNNIVLNWKSLCEWAKDNYSLIDEVLQEFSDFKTPFDIFQLAQEREIVDELRDYDKEIKQLLFINKMFDLDYAKLDMEINYELEEKTRDLLDELLEELENVETFEDIEEIIDKFFEESEDF